MVTKLTLGLKPYQYADLIKIGNLLRWFDREPIHLWNGSSKNKCMPIWMGSTRYSLVKGERIVRFVLLTRLHYFDPNVDRSFIGKLFWVSSDWERCGTLRDGVNVL